MLTSRYFMKIDWNIFREKRCLYCLRPFFPKNPPILSKITLQTTYARNAQIN